MNFSRFRDQFGALPVSRKAILIGSLISIVGTVLPWYQDLDLYGAGDIYLGITGPLFPIGLLILLSSLVVGVSFSLPLFGRRFPRIGVEPSFLALFIGAEDLLLVFIARLIYLHPKFGVNITLKDSRFGMLMTFVGLVVMLWGAYATRSQESKERLRAEQSPMTPFLDLPPQRSHTPVTPRATVQPAYKPQQTPMPIMKKAEKEEASMTSSESQLQRGPNSKIGDPVQPQKGLTKENYMIRMDL